MVSLLAAEVVSVSLGKRRIVEDVSFSAMAGEVTAIIGPNGSGKTTLLKALSGEHAYTGTVRINGRDIARLKPYETARMRAVLPQASVLTFPFTVHEVVRLGLSAGVSGVHPGTDLAARALERVDLAGFGGRMYQSLSGGEQQRVQLARVLCQVWHPVLDGSPRLLLLDEPVSSLDIRHQLLVMDIARQFAAGGGGVIAILHDLNLAALHADRVLAISGGRAVAYGPPAEVLTSALVRDVFECDLATSEIGGTRLFVPAPPRLLAAE
jgi:iron complex transport system ATP-binding protein